MAKDYKDTLNLPKTEFPMKASLAQREPEMLAKWRQTNLYQKIREFAKGRPKFILHDGPPYANGSIHLGTTMNKVLKDIIVKSKTLSGYDAPFVPGWDCHGLPIELAVEKQVGKVGDISPYEFRLECRKYANEQVAQQKNDFERLGVFADWEAPYLTMNYKYEANIVRALAKIVANDHLVRGYKPVHWCTECGSALAEAEVEYRDKESPAIDVSFYAIDPADVLSRFSVGTKADLVMVPIWTTTPWTLPANQAVALHPDVNYVLVECDLHGVTAMMVIAQELLDSVMQRYRAEDYQVLGSIKGKALEYVQLQHPFLQRVVPVISGEHVTTDQGTGCVHTAPAHGLDDYFIGQCYELPLENPVDARSCFLDDIPIVAGMPVHEANDVIINALGERGHLLNSTTLEHSYAHCWRHKNPLIYRATPQWFISMEQNHLREMALKAVQESRWIPSWGQSRIMKMIEGRPDWCISRQRTWGTPIPLLTHRKTGELHPDTERVMEEVATLIESVGIDAWYNIDLEELIGDEADNYEKVTDILDVWFDSGVSHFCVLEKRADLAEPADLYLEGSDQHRGWFQTSLLTSLAIRGESPYKSVLTHGYVVDSKGHKMSKSIGNTIEPGEVIQSAGAEILRLWSAACDHTGEVSFSQEIVKRTSEAYRRIRNTARFLLSNLNDFDPAKHMVPVADMLALDRWAVVATQRLQEKILQAYDRYRFQSIYQFIHNFCSVEMGSFYLDVIKDRQYTSRADGLPRRSAQTAMYHIAEAFVRWLAPILSFTAEEIWQHMPGERTESVFLTTWYEGFSETKDQDEDQAYWQWLMQVRDEVNKALEMRRNAGDIGSALDADVTLYADESVLEKLTSLGDELRFVLITSAAQAMPVSERSGSADECDIPGLWIDIAVSQNQKCARCWQRRADVTESGEYVGLCSRCITNVQGEGEVRRYA